MNITVISFQDKRPYQLRVPQGKETTVLDVKFMLERLHSIPCLLQRLVYPCHEIRDNIRIRDLNMKSATSPIYLILRDEATVTAVRFTIMSVAGARYTVSLPLTAKVVHLLEAISSMANCPIKSFTAWMNHKRLLTPDMQNLPISKVFKISSKPPETHKVYEEFIVIRHKTQPNPTNSVLLRFFRRLVPEKTKANTKILSK
jgi:hypothetical protein